MKKEAIINLINQSNLASVNYKIYKDGKICIKSIKIDKTVYEYATTKNDQSLAWKTLEWLLIKSKI